MTSTSNVISGSNGSVAAQTTQSIDERYIQLQKNLVRIKEELVLQQETLQQKGCALQKRVKELQSKDNALDSRISKLSEEKENAQTHLIATEKRLNVEYAQECERNATLTDLEHQVAANSNLTTQVTQQARVLQERAHALNKMVNLINDVRCYKRFSLFYLGLKYVYLTVLPAKAIHRVFFRRSEVAPLMIMIPLVAAAIGAKLCAVAVSAMEEESNSKHQQLNILENQLEGGKEYSEGGSK